MNCERAAASWDASLERRGAGEDSPRLHDSIHHQRASTDLPPGCRVSVSRRRSLCGSVDPHRSLSYLHPMCVKGLYVFTVLSGLAASGMLQVSGMRIYTSEEVEAVNGTDVRLRCTFESSSPIQPDDVVITWSFRPLKGGPRQSVFYYQRKPFPPPDGIFRKRITWAGDIMGSDASIIIREVKFTYNGTYICQVKNPPDVHGPDGEIKLRVVETASFSGLLLLAFAIAAAISGIVILLLIIASCRRCKRRRQRELEGNEEAPRKERKDPTACHPWRAVHLYLSETSVEIDSSDGMISDPSIRVSNTRDSSSSEEEGPSLDDDDDGDDSD